MANKVYFPKNFKSFEQLKEFCLTMERMGYLLDVNESCYVKEA